MPALDMWVRKGAKPGIAAIKAVRATTGLGFQSDPLWEPVAVKR